MPELLEALTIETMNEFSGATETVLGPLNEVEQKYAPPQLFGAGDQNLLHWLPRICIIGTRNPSSGGVALAREVTRAVVTHGGVVVSGLARGIDTVAHREAVVTGGRTIAVLGTPLSGVYPQDNFDLQQDLMANHLVISEFPDGHPIQRKNFVLRNRTMALLSHASIIIEAGGKSGTQHQGWEAIRLGRLLFLPASMCELRSGWPVKMCEYGAFIFHDVDELPGIFEEFLPSLKDHEEQREVLQ